MEVDSNLTLSDLFPKVKEKKIGRLSNTYFIYTIPKEKNIRLNDDNFSCAHKVNYNILDNIVGFISHDIGSGLPVEEEGNFNGSSSSSHDSLILSNEQFKQWYDLEMKSNFKWKKERKCGLCDKKIEYVENFSLWEGVGYHRKDCFAEDQNKEWDYFRQSNRTSYNAEKYLMKIIENFDKENPNLKEIITKFKITDLQSRVGSAYENYFVPFILHQDRKDTMSVKQATKYVKEEIDEAQKNLIETSITFSKLMEENPNQKILTLKRAKILLNVHDLTRRIEKVFEEGEDFSGVNLEYVKNFKKIERQCEILFDSYVKFLKLKK